MRKGGAEAVECLCRHFFPGREIPDDDDGYLRMIEDVLFVAEFQKKMIIRAGIVEAFGE